MNPVLATILQILIVPGTALLTWLISRRKSDADIQKIKAETAGQEIKNMEAIVVFWKTMVDDLSREVQDLKKEVIEFTQENKEFKKELHQLREENERLKNSISKL